MSLIAQQGVGVKYEKGKSWDQIVEKAKQNNKFIFLDCFATWCGPCKAMDKYVFTNENIVSKLNDKFICVKVQMDKTDTDNLDVRNWYHTASLIESAYNVTSFPTFLFFNSNGEPIHKAVGYRDTTKFREEVINALTPNKQYYAILNNFRPGMFDTSELKGLARAFQNTDMELSQKIALDYLNRISLSQLGSADNIEFMSDYNELKPVQDLVANFLNTLSRNEITENRIVNLINAFKENKSVQAFALQYLSSLNDDSWDNANNLVLMTLFKENQALKERADKYIYHLSSRIQYSKNDIRFITAFTQSSKDIGFRILFEKASIIDAAMQEKDYADNIVDDIIIGENLDSSWSLCKDKNDDPNWDSLYQIINKKYNRYHAKRVILFSKARFYNYRTQKYNRNWPQYIEYNLQVFEKIKTDTSNYFRDYDVNAFLYNDVFFHCNDIKQLKRGIRLMSDIVKRRSDNVGYLDTYANLLYKTGKKKEALAWEQKALEISISERLEYKVKVYEVVIAKMKAGIPTWTNMKN